MNESVEKTVQDNEEVEIDLGRIFRALWKNFLFIILATVLCGLIALLVSVFVIHPTYRTGFTAYVNNHSQTDSTSSLTSGDTTAAQSLTYTYASIMSSRSVVMDAAKTAGLDSSYTYDSLKECISTEVETDTQLVNLYVTMESADDAYNLAQAIEETAPDYITDIVDGTSMKIVSEAVYPDKKYSPSYSKNTIIGCVLGALLMIIIITVRELTDNRVKSSDQLEEMFGISVIGEIPDFKMASEGKYGYVYYGSKKGSKKGSNQ